MRKVLLEIRRNRTVGGPMLALASERGAKAEGSRPVDGRSKASVATCAVGAESTLVVALSSAGAVVTSRTKRSQQSACETGATGPGFAGAPSAPSQQQALSPSPRVRQQTTHTLVDGAI